jgi:hypothetical protein
MKSVVHIQLIFSVSIMIGYKLYDRDSIPGRAELLLFATTCRLTQTPVEPPNHWVLRSLFSGSKATRA